MRIQKENLSLIKFIKKYINIALSNKCITSKLSMLRAVSNKTSLTTSFYKFGQNNINSTYNKATKWCIIMVIS
jgi:hypothetical protein